MWCIALSSVCFTAFQRVHNFNNVIKTKWDPVFHLQFSFTAWHGIIFVGHTVCLLLTHSIQTNVLSLNTKNIKSFLVHYLFATMMQQKFVAHLMSLVTSRLFHRRILQIFGIYQLEKAFGKIFAAYQTGAAFYLS